MHSFAIGIENSKTPQNIGTLWRSAHIFGASMIFTVGRRYTRQVTDITKAWHTIPLINFSDVADLLAHLPQDWPLIGIELAQRAKPIWTFSHPRNCCYLLGAEDHGLSRVAVERCHSLVVLPGEQSMNVASAGTVVMYDRHIKSLGSSAGRAAA